MSRNGKIERVCLFCNKKFYAYPYRLKIGKAKFCSRSCVHQYNTQYIGSKKHRKFQSILKTKYNISINDLEILKIKQDNKCAICNKKRKLVIDHNHINNKIRGLLCNQCNTALGLLEDNVDRLNNAVNYLIKNI